MSENVAQVAVIMGSISDWDTMKEACVILEKFNISYTKNIVSAHRTPEYMMEFAKSARSKGYQVIIAGAGGAAHLPGMVASLTTLPVLGVPVQSKALSGVDSLHSIVQMPKGVPVGTLAIGSSGAANAGLLAARILSLQSEKLTKALDEFVEAQKKDALSREGEMKL
jgi:5-(carboxyamino)imidazole ribonucleotide mutase